MSTSTVTAKHQASPLTQTVPEGQPPYEQLFGEAFASHLKLLAKEHAEEYRTNTPFPSIHFDNFLPLDVAEAALRDFPEKKQIRWSQFSNENEVKTKSVRKILPLFNRLAMFSTTSKSYHGHPHPLTCPPDRSRRSMAVYYYTNGRPEEEVREGHDTLFQAREGAAKSPLFKVKKMLRAVTPPILMDAVTRKQSSKD